MPSTRAWRSSTRWTATCSARPSSWRSFTDSKYGSSETVSANVLGVMPRLFPAVLVVTLLSSAGAIRLSAQTDLDAFMKDVVARRDDNWKKLQQYILDEREETILNGPGGLRLWGEQKDYTWFIRDGFFIKSPVKANGASIGEADRRKFENTYLRALQRREARGR